MGALSRQDIELQLPGMERRMQHALRQAQVPPRRPGPPNNVLPDERDLRDYVYQPGLIEIASCVAIPDFLWPLGSRERRDESTQQGGQAADPSEELRQRRRVERQRKRLIRDQGGEGSCTGHALAAVIDVQKLRREFGRPTGDYFSLSQNQTKLQRWATDRASARMLYELARSYEFAPESQLQGSSLRNALKAFRTNGVCSEGSSPYTPFDMQWTLSIELAREARLTTLGTYFRVTSNIYDYHAALNEVGAILVSGVIHKGWKNLTPTDAPTGRLAPYEISYDDAPTLLGGHAFAIVGYNEEGFYVLNCWGSSWGVDRDQPNPGVPGVALWRYEDWRRHVMDAWVFRVGAPSENAFVRKGGFGNQINAITGTQLSGAPRFFITGHYLNLSGASYVRRGRYPNDASTLQFTHKFLCERFSGQKPGRHYNSLMFFFMSGTASLRLDANTIEALTRLYKEAEIYPIFIFWNYVELAHIVSIVDANQVALMQRHGAQDRAINLRVEKELREFGELFWSRMERQIDSATKAHIESLPLYRSLTPLIDCARKFGKSVHLASHSDGVRLLEAFCTKIKRDRTWYAPLKGAVKSVSLFSPLCQRSEIRNVLACANGKGAPIYVATLPRTDELADSVGIYQGTYPQLIQNVFVRPLKQRGKGGVIGLHDIAAEQSKRTLTHVVAPPTHSSRPLLHFAMLENGTLMKSMIEHLR